MNRVDETFQKKHPLLTVYYTAGFPNFNDTFPILEELQKSGVDIVEIGIPFSDPVSDGETIQKSSQTALENGISLKSLFQQIENFRKKITIPVFLMGYINPILQFGIQEFCEKCKEIGIDGVIIPDLPLELYEENYKSIFEKNNILNIFLVTPQTLPERIRKIDELSKGFIYLVSSASITGAKSKISEEQIQYFERIKAMNLQNPIQIGFGISTHQTYKIATQYANGAIVGSAFIQHLEQNKTTYKQSISFFVKELRNAE